jgi:hypothetical protein
VNAVLFGIGAINHLHRFGLQHRAFHLKMGLLFTVFALLYITVSVGLWKLSSWSRVGGVWLAIGASVFAAYIEFKYCDVDLSWKVAGPEGWLGFSFGFLLLFGWFINPVYVLRRPLLLDRFSHDEALK